jgi:peptidoglycan/LPS O-acetylase OafA/YrhL
MGVVAFFVLSGFLITRVVVEAVEEHRWSVRGFYTARAVRLVPAQFLMVTVTAAWWLAAGGSPGHVARASAAASGYVENVTRLWQPGSPFSHTGSLAVEEQFYLVWPLAVLWLLRLRRPWQVLAAVAGTSLVLRWLLAGGSLAPLAFGSTPTNAYALVAGAALAFAVPRLPDAPRALGPLALGLLVLAAGWAAGRPSAGITLAPVAAVPAVALVWAAATSGVPGLGNRAIRFLGRISYALYLWNSPLLFFTGTQGSPAAALIVAVAVALATASTLLVEEPLRRRWKRHARTPRPTRLDDAGAEPRRGPARAERERIL